MEPVQKRDIRDGETAEEVADIVATVLREYAQKIMDQNEYEIVVQSPSESDNGNWVVMWEGGPENWPITVIQQRSLGSEEFPEFELGKSPIEGVLEHPTVSVDCKNSYSLDIYEDV